MKLLVLALALLASTLAADCTLTAVGTVPLNDMPATAFYQGEPGGLYPGGQNMPPAAHASAGLSIASQIQPLDSSGAPDATGGKIVLISVGMSNTTQEFSSGGSGSFKPTADLDPSRNPRVIIVDGAQGGQTGLDWANTSSTLWITLDARLASAGVTARQVQAAWSKMAERNPASLGAFPAHAQALRDNAAQTLRNLKSRFPNLRIVYLSSRTRAYTNVSSSLNPEPYAYESAFAVRWVIESQILGTGNLNWDPSGGAVVAPWVTWGPYLWADGTTPRSDGFTWACSDTEGDFTHPSTSGEQKVARLLTEFFKTEPTARSWYLRQQTTGQAPQCSISASQNSGLAPLSVTFTGTATDPDGSIQTRQWNFGDGGLTQTASPTKVFYRPGTYTVTFNVTDNSGNPATTTVTINVLGTASASDWMIY